VSKGGLGMQVAQRGPGAPVGVWGQSPQKPDMHIQSAVYKRIFRDVFIEDIRCTFRLMRSLLPPPLLLQKLFEIVQISRPTLAEVGWARAHPCPTVATPLLGVFRGAGGYPKISHWFRTYSTSGPKSKWGFKPPIFPWHHPRPEITHSSI